MACLALWDSLAMGDALAGLRALKLGETLAGLALGVGLATGEVDVKADGLRLLP